MENNLERRELIEISIILPIHGEGPFLSETLSSIKNQDFNSSRFELVAILDRPGTRVEQEIELYAEQNSNVNILKSSTPGIVSALNLGIKNSRGKYIARIDSDDKMHESRLSTQYAVLESDSSLACVGSQISFINENNDVIGTSHYPASPQDIGNVLTYRNCIAHPSVMFKKSIFQNIERYNIDFEGCEDYELWLRLFNGNNIVNINTPLTDYRIWGSQVTQSRQSEILKKITRLRVNCFSAQNQAYLQEKTFLRLIHFKQPSRKMLSSFLIDKAFHTLKFQRGLLKLSIFFVSYFFALALNPIKVTKFSFSYLKPRIR
jgi:glycosyltransferase involved in cell wall biosynthesis